MASSLNDETCFVNVEISRGSEPEYELDFKTIENLNVLDEHGECKRIGDIYKQKKTILILVRVRDHAHFCFR